MEVIIDLIKITLPASLVLYAVYLVVKSFLNKEFQVGMREFKTEHAKLTLPLKLQAYERMTIFLERISPNNLIPRLNDPSYNVIQLHALIVTDIKEEYNHNLAQQIYLSDEAWHLLTKAKEELISLVNGIAHDLDNEAPSIQLAKKIFEVTIEGTTEDSVSAMKFLKDEVRAIL